MYIIDFIIYFLRALSLNKIRSENFIWRYYATLMFIGPCIIAIVEE